MSVTVGVWNLVVRIICWRTWNSNAIFFGVVRPVSHKREKTEINDRQRENDAEERPLSLFFFSIIFVFFFKGRSQWGRREWVPTGIERFFFVSVFGSAQTTSDGQQKQTAVNLFWPNWKFFFGLGAEMGPRGDQPRRIEWNDCNTSQWSVLLRHVLRWRWLSEGCLIIESFDLRWLPFDTWWPSIGSFIDLCLSGGWIGCRLWPGYQLDKVCFVDSELSKRN